MRTDPSKRIYLRAYRPPRFEIETVALNVFLDPEETRIENRMSVRPGDDNTADTALELDGENIELLDIFVNDRVLPPGEYEVTDGKLTLFRPPLGQFELRLTTSCNPSANTQLSGLYRTNGTYCTQCEAEGFRRITFFLDRPDILARYTVRLEAQRDEAPTLLANGNLRAEGAVAGSDRHFAVWEDPFPKPSYLFAMVGGTLSPLSDHFITASGRDVALNIYVQPGMESKAHYAMDALKRAMRWDEEKFGREYDLDLFNIVAVPDFNMGAMENKGLNIFNDKYILASPSTATDADYANIEAIVAHEYFHNWTGNRITCRDWFQLCLKEGLTVYRDQEFSADMRDRAVERIRDVRNLRTHQFSEDAGSLAHPVRPAYFAEINNFYTATVYEKGAELVRMLATLLGPTRFAEGMDLYFNRYDGTAATVEDFLGCFEDASGRDLSQFMGWYAQAGTPRLRVEEAYDSAAATYTLHLTQYTPPTPEQPEKVPMHIPIRFALLTSDGTAVPSPAHGQSQPGDILELSRASQTFTFDTCSEPPALSLLREFSAPVILERSLSEAVAMTLGRYDQDGFARWEVINHLSLNWLERCYHDLAAGNDGKIEAPPKFLALLQALIDDPNLAAAYRAELLHIPGDNDLSMRIGTDINPQFIYDAWRNVAEMLGRALSSSLNAIYGAHPRQAYRPDAESAGQRALRNYALLLRGIAAAEQGAELAREHYRAADNMTDMMAALQLLTHIDSPLRRELFADFYDTHQDDPLVVDKWFMLEAAARRNNATEEIERLTQHAAFSWHTPNRIWALIGGYIRNNLVGFHQVDGTGYRLLRDAVLRLDQSNPQTAARLLTLIKNWRQLEPRRRHLIERELGVILDTGSLSGDVREIASRALGRDQAEA